MATLRRMLEAARCLTEPGEVNPEYARGQANLIADLGQLPGEYDLYHGVLMDVIGHEVTVDEAMLIIREIASRVIAEERS